MEQRIVIRNFPFYRFFLLCVYNYCVVFFRIILLHMCATWWGLVNMQGPCDHLMVHFLSGFTFYSVSSSTMLKVTWTPEWNVILHSVGRYRESFDGGSWYVHGFSPHLVLLRHVTSRKLTRHSCRDDIGLMPVGKSGRCTFLCVFIQNLVVHKGSSH